MNQSIKTYGVMINLDYAHQPINECKAIWDKIVQNMQKEDFHIDKRMFTMITFQERNFVCEKARRALNKLDEDVEFYNKHSFEYITDFFIIDMSDYVDLRLPEADLGVVLKGQYQCNIQTLQH